MGKIKAMAEMFCDIDTMESELINELSLDEFIKVFDFYNSMSDDLKELIRNEEQDRKNLLMRNKYYFSRQSEYFI